MTLGAYMDHLCIVGGLVPTLLVDGADDVPGHPGTNDLDIALAAALLDDHRYAEISRCLRREDFEPDRNEKGNTALQRWKMGGSAITVDFLIPPLDATMQGGRIKVLQSDFGALVAPGLQLAFDERELVPLQGHTLTGEAVTRTVGVCGPAAFVVLKALALADRGAHKDAFDLVYVIRGWPDGKKDLVARLRHHAAVHREIVERALSLLARDFADLDNLGPQRYARFALVDEADFDAAAADARGHVQDLLRGYGQAS